MQKQKTKAIGLSCDCYIAKLEGKISFGQLQFRIFTKHLILTHALSNYRKTNKHPNISITGCCIISTVLLPVALGLHR